MDHALHRDALSGETARSGKAQDRANSAFLTARVSPNGRYLAFMSEASLTGYDNEDVNPAPAANARTRRSTSTTRATG